jgi:hypothetical protein
MYPPHNHKRYPIMHPNDVSPLGRAFHQVKAAYFLTDEDLADMARAHGLSCSGATIQKVSTGAAPTMGFDKVQAIAAEVSRRFSDTTLAGLLAPGMTITPVPKTVTNGSLTDEALDVIEAMGMALDRWKQRDYVEVRRKAIRLRRAADAMDAEALRMMAPPIPNLFSTSWNPRPTNGTL